MGPDKRSWIIWGLLAVCFCLGSVAFAEELNLWDETSTQDEAALSELCMTLKSDASLLEEHVIRVMSATVSPSAFYLSTSHTSLTNDISWPLSSALRSHQAICIYRI